ARGCEAWLEEGAPGHGAPQELCIEDRCVDPRVTGLVVFDDDSKILGVQGLFAVHGTSLGSTVDHYNPDWAGPAARVAAEHLADRGHDAVVGWACGAAGDMSPVPQPPGRTDDGPRPKVQGQELANAVGERVGEALARAAEEASSASFDLAAALHVWNVSESGLPGARFGLATLGGAIDGQHPVLFPIVGRGVRKSVYGKNHPQYPKMPAIPGFLMNRWAPSELPLQVVRIGTHAMATVPGEPSVATAWRLEQALCALDGIETASVVGYSGEYAGYWTTPEEYDEQLYQGASTLYGRQATPALIEQLVRVAERM
ncbi:MAG: neutral ceramidase, partial [Kiritimatiellia bacterium]